MIEWIKSESNHTIPVCEGISLASKRNPIIDAERWIEQYVEKIESHTNILVLGYGAGFHVQKLHQMYPNKKVLVLEAIEELFHQRQVIENVKILFTPTADEIWNYFEWQDFMNKGFTLLEHTGTTQVRKKTYAQITEECTGRNKQSFLRHVRSKSNQTKIFQNINENQIADTHLLSAKDISQISVVQKTQTTSAYLWRFLGELLK
jgi:hypothetical protein